MSYDPTRPAFANMKPILQSSDYLANKRSALMNVCCNKDDMCIKRKRTPKSNYDILYRNNRSQQLKEVTINNKASLIANTRLTGMIYNIPSVIANIGETPEGILLKSIPFQMYYESDPKQSVMFGNAIHYCNNKLNIYSDISFIPSSNGQGYVDNSPVTDGCYNKEMMLIFELTINGSVKKILQYLSEFKSGNFKNVQLALSEFTPLAKALFDLKNLSEYTNYEFIRQSIILAFESYIQSIYQYLDMTTLESKLLSVTERASILDDMAKLEDYIRELEYNATMHLIPVVDIYAPTFTLQEEYNSYIKLYGFPEGGVFDPDLLGPLIPKVRLL